MKTLVLGANKSSTNYGVRVLAEGTESIANDLGATSVSFYNFGDLGPGFPLTRKNLVREIAYSGPIRRWLSEFELIIDTGLGDSFTDIYGALRLTQVGLLRKLATTAGVTVVMGPQTVGPFSSWSASAFARWTMSDCKVVMTRDSISYELASKLCGKMRPIRSTDVVFALSGTRQVPDGGVLFNVSGLLWNPNSHVDNVKYRALVERSIVALRESGKEVSLLAHVHGGSTSDDDEAAVQELFDRDIVSAVLAPKTLGDMRDVISRSEVVVASRMHACLNALSLGVPALPLAYSRKFEPLMRDIGWSPSIDLKNPGVSAVAEEVLKCIELGGEAMDTRGRGRLLLAESVSAAKRTISMREVL